MKKKAVGYFTPSSTRCLYCITVLSFKSDDTCCDVDSEQSFGKLSVFFDKFALSSFQFGISWNILFRIFEKCDTCVYKLYILYIDTYGTRWQFLFPKILYRMTNEYLNYKEIPIIAFHPIKNAGLTRRQKECNFYTKHVLRIFL